MTSSPAPTPRATSTRTSESVPFATPIASRTPRKSAASRSKAATFGPRMKSALASTPSIASRMRGSSGSYCAFTSTSGIGRTPGKSRGEIEQAEGDSGDHEIIEVFADAVVVRPDRPADPGKAETEDGAADRREAEEA